LIVRRWIASEFPMNQPGINLKSGSTAKLGAPKLRTDFRPKLIFCRHLSPPASFSRHLGSRDRAAVAQPGRPALQSQLLGCASLRRSTFN
jgi:hypothetical protein